ncbi:hypothetical protein HYU22_01545 [Candidatus Woesearchaeota archaeon]|nr:hypothetical protein [Candidatus Woesearchaeota archaeon]
MKDLLQRIGFVTGLGITGLLGSCTTKTEMATWHLGKSCESGAQTYNTVEMNFKQYHIAGILLHQEALWPAKRTIYRCESGSPVVEREELRYRDGSRMVFTQIDGTY